MSSADFECNKLIKRDITIPDCRETNHPDDCNRSYFLQFPSIACKLLQQNSSNDGDSNQLDTLPLVFAIHCFGCPANAMFTFAQHVDEYNAILVVPEGIQHSWNARYCCGYALSNNVDDIGFIAAIQSTLGEEYEFIQPQYTYATGWSNGGFMVMHASNLFRAIAPISGFIGDLDTEVTGDKSTGKGLFIHQGRDDRFVRPTGCCNDPNLPKCCCDIAADTCTGVMDVARNWAIQVNGCQDDKNLLVETSYSNTDEGIECLTSSSNDKANTTICLYEHSGHFNSPSFGKAFPMADEVINFFARDACEINNGKWDRKSKTCSCNSKILSGTFCLDAAHNTDGGNRNIKEPSSISRGMVTIMIGFIILFASYVMMQKLRRRRAKKNGRGKYAKVEEFDIEMDETINL